MGAETCFDYFLWGWYNIDFLTFLGWVVLIRVVGLWFFGWFSGFRYFLCRMLWAISWVCWVLHAGVWVVVLVCLFLCWVCDFGACSDCAGSDCGLVDFDCE